MVSSTPWCDADGTDVTVVGYGASLKTILRAADTAQGEGVSIEAIDVRSLAPLDIDVWSHRWRRPVA